MRYRTIDRLVRFAVVISLAAGVLVSAGCNTGSGNPTDPNSNVNEGPPTDPVPLNDADGDGVGDELDNCPDTPSDVEVDDNGCAASQRDSDVDGVTDDLDDCPDTPAGEGVDDVGCPADEPPGGPSCGDGVVDAGEDCDGGGESAACNTDCTVASCGDGIVNGTAGEACDDGGESAACNTDCTVASCGDGIVNGTAGEACDDGGESATCSADCTLTNCGDGLVDAGEACDDGGESAACNANCTLSSCGDGIVNGAAGEECDDGGESAACNTNCTAASCGDGVVNRTAGEACDDGGASATCNADCILTSCGDGIVNGAAGEECDDGGESAACNTNCTLSSCGDGIVNGAAGEECDDGGESAECNTNCTLSSCGDGIVNGAAGEECDDGGESPACNADCTLASGGGPRCGDGSVDAGEECDDGGESAACNANCTPASCGDGIVNETAGEECDDRGESSACNANCTPASCGDSIVNETAGEECDPDPPDEMICTDECLRTGSCCAANGTPGCEDAACREAVCAVDPYCCGQDEGVGFWDDECVQGAIDLCGLGVDNDDCASTSAVVDGITPFGNLCAMTDGPEDEGTCAFLQADVWFCYTASCTGFATISLCESERDYDTMMAVYEGCGCPAGGSLQCSDDDCGLDRQSRLVFEVEEGQSFTIRIGGYPNPPENKRGQGTMSITCGAEDPCGPGAGDCFAENGTPGCEDLDCCREICAQDPYCCDFEWDDLCVGTAWGLCGEGFAACETNDEPCAVPHDTPGCSDQDCCQTVCESDLFCCMVEWDQFCADAADNCP